MTRSKPSVCRVAQQQADIAELALGDRPPGMGNHPWLVIQPDHDAVRSDQTAQHIEHS
jgi:hypothetical protein